MQRGENNNGFNWLRRYRKHLIEQRPPRIGRVPDLCPTLESLRSRDVFHTSNSNLADRRPPALRHFFGLRLPGHGGGVGKRAFAPPDLA